MDDTRRRFIQVLADHANSHLTVYTDSNQVATTAIISAAKQGLIARRWKSSPTEARQYGAIKVTVEQGRSL